MQFAILTISSSRETTQSMRMTHDIPERNKIKFIVVAGKAGESILQRIFHCTNKNHMKKNRIAIPLIIKNLRYPSTKSEVAHNFPVKLQHWLNINTGSSATLLQWRQNCCLPFSRNQGVNRQQCILRHVKSLSSETGVAQHFRVAQQQLKAGVNANQPHPRMWGRRGEDNTPLLLKGKKSQISAVSFWQYSNRGADSFNAKLILKKKKKLHLSTWCILHLWVCFAIMHITDAKS